MSEVLYDCLSTNGYALAKGLFVRSGVRTHALFRGPDLESGALDRSAILTSENPTCVQSNHSVGAAELGLERRLHHAHPALVHI